METLLHRTTILRCPPPGVGYSWLHRVHREKGERLRLWLRFLSPERTNESAEEVKAKIERSKIFNLRCYQSHIHSLIQLLINKGKSTG
jgi:hypothetical protein